MTRSFNDVRSSLVEILQDQDYKAIALTGKWGTGKTHLWETIAKDLEANNGTASKPIYISLFGANSIDALKIRILQNAYIRDATAVRKAIDAGGGIVKDLFNAIKSATGFSTQGAATGLALIWFHNIIKDRLIVIDDVERKHKSLGLDEFLGLIDEYSGAHKTRFLLILNTGGLLSDKIMWETLHEKVIDAEVILDPPAYEAFEIATNGNDKPYLSDARAAVVNLDINNIRVILRILRNMQRVYNATKGTADVLASRWVPSTALLTACQYRAIENCPPFEYIRSFNQFASSLKNKNNDERDPRELEWDILLNKMGIVYADAYEEIFQQFLRSGVLDHEKLKALFESYRREQVNAEAFNKQSEIFAAFRWDSHRNETELLEMTKQLFPFINVLGPDSITDIVSLVKTLGDNDLAQKFLDSWIASIEMRQEYQTLNDAPFDFSLREYHPDVVKKMNEMRDMQNPPLSVLETANRIIEKGGWGARERYSLRNSTIQDYENALKEADASQLKKLISLYLDWLKRPAAYDENFQIGMDNFIKASSNIYLADPNSRLSKIVHRAFESSGLKEKLVHQAA